MARAPSSETRSTGAPGAAHAARATTALAGPDGLALAAVDAGHVVDLQRMAGNRAVTNLLGPAVTVQRDTPADLTALIGQSTC